MKRLGAVLTVVGLTAWTLGYAPQPAAAQNGLSVIDLQTLDPEALADALVGVGVTVVEESVTFIGDERAGGLFSGGTGIVGIEDGIILSSGQVVDVVGPNESPGTTTVFGTPGDDDLGDLAGVDTFDAAILEFEFEVGGDADQVFFNYVFGSEEYNEFVGSAFNDVFAFWVNGVICALVNGAPVSINTVNNGQPDVGPTNPHLYINNDPFDPDSTGETVEPGDLLDTEMDGLTVVLTCEANVHSGTNTMRMGIADGGDRVLDSWVLIQAGSLTTIPPDSDTTVCEEGEDCGATASNDEATVSIECPADECEFITLTVDDEAQAVCGDASCEVSGFIDVRAEEGADKDGTFLLMALDITEGVLGPPARVQFFYDGELIDRCRPRGDFTDPGVAARVTTPCILRSTSPDEDESNQIEILFRLRNFDEDPPWGVR